MMCEAMRPAVKFVVTRGLVRDWMEVDGRFKLCDQNKLTWHLAKLNMG